MAGNSPALRTTLNLADVTEMTFMGRFFEKGRRRRSLTVRSPAIVQPSQGLLAGGQADLVKRGGLGLAAEPGDGVEQLGPVQRVGRLGRLGRPRPASKAGVAVLRRVFTAGLLPRPGGRQGETACAYALA